MPKFIVNRRTVSDREMYVEAPTAEAAIRKARCGDVENASDDRIVGDPTFRVIKREQ